MPRMVKPKVIRVMAKMKGTPVPMVLWASSEERVNRATVMTMFFRRPVRRLSKSTKPPAIMPSTKGMTSLGVLKCQTRVAAMNTLAKTGREAMIRGLSGGVFMMVLFIIRYEVNDWILTGFSVGFRMFEIG